MRIDHVEICNFRNYAKAKLDFHEHINVLYGDNAQGKTNILESIFVSGTTKSHKGSKDRELIRIGQEEAHIRVLLTKNDISHRIDMHLRKNKPKGIAMELSQLDHVYLHDLGEYNKILNQRNKLLKQIYYNPSLKDTLEIWDEQLLDYGCRLIRRRREFVEQLKEIVYHINQKLTGGREQLSVRYEPDAGENEFEKKLKDNTEKDLRFMTTNVGPHRDDLSFFNGDVDLRKYGSQGQQRTCALSLKLAEIELVRQLIHDQPILLLDDVLSELDRNRQNYLLDSIQDTQTIITCTGLEEFIDGKLTLDRVFRVVDGTISVE